MSPRISARNKCFAGFIIAVFYSVLTGSSLSSRRTSKNPDLFLISMFDFKITFLILRY